MSDEQWSDDFKEPYGDEYHPAPAPAPVSDYSVVARELAQEWADDWAKGYALLADLADRISTLVTSAVAEKEAEIERLGRALENLVGDLYLVDCGEITRQQMNAGSRQEALTAAAAWHNQRGETK